MSLRHIDKHHNNYYMLYLLFIVVIFAGIVVFIGITSNANPLVEKAYGLCTEDSGYCNEYDICTGKARSMGKC